ncbi:GNAT family N-acetyltransferase [Solibacillus silvestris]|uniref:GNAT family N-acetyltransferase n=1 Tax=Solibacillus silvestris TaxID=76853 RepID=UPI003F803306
MGERALWGEGIGGKTVQKLLDYARERLGITTFLAETHETNIRSRRMLEKVGFKEVGTNGSEFYLGEEAKLVQYKYCLDE